MKFIEKELKTTISITNIVNVHFFEFPKDFYTEKDSHPFYELIFVSSGRLFIKSDDYNGILEKNQMILHKPNEVHSLSCEENSAPTVIIIGFNCDNNNIDAFTTLPTKLNSVEIKNLAEIIKEGRNVFAPPYDKPTFDMKKKENIILGSEQILKIMLEYFLIRLLRKKYSFEEKIEQISNEKLAINEITNYLDDNFTEKVSIDELAFIFNTNRATLCKEFKNSTNKTINEYINDIKIEKAKVLLKTTKKSITYISEKLGFESIHYFTRFFKQRKGVTPTKYRNKNL